MNFRNTFNTRSLTRLNTV